MALLDSKQLNPRLTGSFTLSGSLSTEKNTRIVSNLTEIIKVTVVSDNGNKYAFEGATAPSITVAEGKTYRFDTSDSTNSTHPFRFSTTLSGSWGGGSAYTTGVTVNGTAGQNNSYTEISISKVTPNHLYYYCTAHANMGNDGKLLKNDFTNLHLVSGSSVSTGSFGHLVIQGNVTASGTIKADAFESNTGGETINFGDNLSVTGQITASGNIDTTSGRVFEQGTSVIDHATAMAIVFGG
jgi:plastocyanin|tara:strand:+ start:57 stop:776 length:720 start_codon:yes stop_codon:yes gene_type:complete